MTDQKKKQPKKFKRKTFLFESRDIEDLKIVHDYIENKYGVDDDTAAIKTALRHYAEHVRNNELH